MTKNIDFVRWCGIKETLCEIFRVGVHELSSPAPAATNVGHVRRLCILVDRNSTSHRTRTRNEIAERAFT